MPRQANTKEKILDVALELFAEKGFDRVKMADIAKAVGCAPGALYKHYESKDDVYDAMIERSIEGYKKSMQDAAFAFKEDNNLDDSFSQMTEDKFVELAKKRLGLAIHFEKARLFRKLMVVEQFARPDLAKIYDERYIKGQILETRYIFNQLVKAGIFRPGNIDAMSMLFLAPINTLIGYVDRNPDEEDNAMYQLEVMAREFFRAYKA